MCGRRKPSGSHAGTLTARLYENELAMKFDLVGCRDALVEVLKIYTAAQENVLTIVDRFAACVVGSGPTAQKWTRFINADTESNACQCRTGSESGKSTAGDRYRAHESLGGKDEFPCPTTLVIVEKVHSNPNDNRQEEDVGGLKCHRFIVNRFRCFAKTCSL